MRIMLLGAAISNHTLRWANSLSERGHNVLLVCRADQKAKKENISINTNVKIHYLRHGGGIGYYLNVPELCRVWSNFKPDVTNVHYATGYGTMARLANIHPLVLSFFGSDIYEYPLKNRVNWHLLNMNITKADALAATSHAMANRIKEVYPKLNKSVTVTPFGVDTELFKPQQRVENKRPVIGIVKYLKPIYDIQLLINAFAIIKKETQLNPLLEIYGGGPLLKNLKELCKSLAVENDVVFHGTIPNTEIPKAINKMDVFVNCSLRESFGVALVEAMACGVPVVATDTEGFKEVVKDGVTGIILKDRNPKTMANALVKILSNPKLGEEYGENGRKHVLNNYDWYEDVAIMENLYMSLLSNKGE